GGAAQAVAFSDFQYSGPAGASRTLDHAATGDDGRAPGGVVGGIQPAASAGLNRLRLRIAPDFQYLISNEARQKSVRIQGFALCGTEQNPPDESPTPKSIRSAPICSPKAAFPC